MTQGVKPLGSEPRTAGGISEAGNQTPVEVHVTGTRSAPQTGGAPAAGGGAAALTTPNPSGAEIIPATETAGQPYTAENADFGGAEPSKPGVHIDAKDEDKDQKQIFTAPMPGQQAINEHAGGTGQGGGEHQGITPGTELQGMTPFNPNPGGSSGPDTRPGVRTPSGPRDTGPVNPSNPDPAKPDPAKQPQPAKPPQPKQQPKPPNQSPDPDDPV